MLSYYCRRQLFLLLTICFSWMNPAIAFAQTAVVKVDTTIIEPESVQLADIPIQLGEAMIQSRRLYESMISEERIEDIVTSRKALLHQLDSMMLLDKKLDLKANNIRFLNNKLGFWKKFEATLESKTVALSGIFQTINQKKNKVKKEIELWENTRIVLEKDKPDESVFERIDILLFQLDTIRQTGQKKSDRLLAMLDQSIEAGVILDDFINQIDHMVSDLKDDFFVFNQHSFFGFKFAEKDTWSYKSALRFFYDTEVEALLAYFTYSKPNSIISLSIILLLVILLKVFKSRILSAPVREDSVYQKTLYKILSRSFSAALILGLFISVLLFPNRPELVKDLLKILVIFPIAIITSTFTNKAFHKYIYVFAGLLIIHTVYIVFPSDHIYYSLFLIFICIVLIYMFIKLIQYYSRHKDAQTFRSKIIVFVLILHLISALGGLIAVLSGATLLAGILIRIPIASVFGGILVIIVAILLNGLISIGVENPQVLKLNIFRVYGTSIKKKAIQIINLLAIGFWIKGLFDIINISRPILTWTTEFLTDEIKIESLSFSLASVGMFFLVIWIAFFLGKVIQIILEEDILNRLNLAKGVPHTTAVLVRYTLISLGFMVAISATGIPMDSMTVIFGAFGVGIGFGLQNIFNNLVSGLILLFERPIQIGDTVEVGTLMGNVKSIGIRSSNVRTFDGAEVIVPNGQFISQEVINWTLSDMRKRIEIMAGVAYGSDPHKVRELLLEALDGHVDVLKFPPPRVYFQELGESSLDFRLLFWTGNFDEGLRLRSEVMFLVHDVLQREGISIPFPQRDLHIKSMEEGVGLIKKKG